MGYAPNRHHRRSYRLPGYDYSAVGSYFVTLCADNRERLFGEVIRGKVLLNDYGRVVLDEWRRSAELRREIELDAVVVMPNHLHGVVTITDVPQADDPTSDRAHRRAPLQRRPKSLGSFVAGFKSATTKRINALRGLPGTPVWQRDYHDHVIRTDDAYARIYNYILTNPGRWELDRENPDRWGTDDFDGWLQPGEPTPDRRDPTLSGRTAVRPRSRQHVRYPATNVPLP